MFYTKQMNDWKEAFHMFNQVSIGTAPMLHSINSFMKDLNKFYTRDKTIQNPLTIQKQPPEVFYKRRCS